jgi:hypothetical protein
MRWVFTAEECSNDSQLIDLTLVERAPQVEKDGNHQKEKPLMSLLSCSHLGRCFFQELYILTTKASQGQSVTQEDFCHSLGLVCDERLNGKPRRKGCV